MEKENGSFTEKFNCKAPLLFALPQSDYSSEMERKRDKGFFLKMQQLEKKSHQLREQMELLLQKHSLQLSRTQQLVIRSYGINNRFIERRANARVF